MPTQSKAGVVATATIIGSISGLIAMFLKWSIGPYHLGFPMFIGMSIFIAPIGSGFLSLILSNYWYNHNFVKKYIYSACAVLSFLTWYLLFTYYFAQ